MQFLPSAWHSPDCCSETRGDFYQSIPGLWLVNGRSLWPLIGPNNVEQAKSSQSIHPSLARPGPAQAQRGARPLWRDLHKHFLHLKKCLEPAEARICLASSSLQQLKLVPNMNKQHNIFYKCTNSFLIGSFLVSSLELFLFNNQLFSSAMKSNLVREIRYLIWPI